ncbi:FecR domain-containing protein [Breoghania sp.]|uniref:FecR family protein n=1 Tax=Breoghania sp. TaxID=2065378 RepID=UPI002637775A|nr:FecR domain-containing protein [Breoghania sp.]MDJ0933529.1 FecR domain-containing protein [Breoghania sp.]
MKPASIATGPVAARILSDLALTGALACPLPAAAAPKVGVTAAVNPQAHGTPPNGSTRTLVLGDNIIHRERIQTRGEGLVQVLLVDGSTFTVGPHSDLVIDEFVYDPASGNGNLVASFSKGVARFVGGRLSKKSGGVTVKIPVGTIGIRGGIANLNTLGDNPTFSLIFGDEPSFKGTNGGHRRIYERGYTMELGNGGAVLLRRTQPQDLGRVQRQLISRRGQSGGARHKPQNDDVNRGVSQNNSQLGYSNTTPPPKPEVVLATRINDVDAGGNETNDTNKRTIDTDRPTSLGPGSFRVLTAGDTYVVTGDGTITDPGSYDLVGGSSDTDQTVTGDLFDGNIAMINAAATSLVTTAGITVDGTAYTLPIGLADYGTEPATGSAFWLITGRATDADETDPPPWSASADTFSGLLTSQEYLPEEAITHAGFL